MEGLTITHWGYMIHQCPSCLQGTNCHVHERSLRALRGWAPRNQEFSALWGPSPGMSVHDYLLLSEVFEGMEIINDLVVSLWLWKHSISVSMLTTQKWCCPMGGRVTARVRTFWLLAQDTVMCSVLKAAWERHFLRRRIGRRIKFSCSASSA